MQKRRSVRSGDVRRVGGYSLLSRVGIVWIGAPGENSGDALLRCLVREWLRSKWSGLIGVEWADDARWSDKLEGVQIWRGGVAVASCPEALMLPDGQIE